MKCVERKPALHINANNIVVNQTTHLCSLISNYVAHCLASNYDTYVQNLYERFCSVETHIYLPSKLKLLSVFGLHENCINLIYQTIAQYRMKQQFLQ